MIRKHHIVLPLLALALVGCTDRLSSAEEKMAEIRNSPAAPVQPPPVPEVVEAFTYGASSARSPFLPPSLMNVQLQLPQVSDVRPDPTRQKQALESYELSALIYRGIIIAPNGVPHGLIERPDGIIDSVKEGDYIGTYDGQITKISPDKIKLDEIVPDARVGYVIKTQDLVLSN